MHRLARPLFALGLLLAPVTGRAEEVTGAPPLRKLGEHLFIPREEVLDPFTTSYVASTSGFSYGGAAGPTFDVNGQQVDIEDYQIVAYSQLFAAQWAVADWWALRLYASGLVYSGANAPAAAGIGVNGVMRGGAGTTFSFQLAPTFRLGALIDVAFGPSVGINLLESIRQSIDSGSVKTPVTSTSSTTVTPALSAAWTISRGFGALINVAYSHGIVEANFVSTDLDMLSLQAALDLDLRELGSIPLGLGLNYSAGYSLGEERFRRYVLGAGFFYTGRQELTLGLELAYRRAPLGVKDVFVKAIYALFSLRYSFN